MTFILFFSGKNMQFLTIKKQKRERKDGRPYAQAVVIKKTRKFGQVIEQKGISTKKPVLITCAHASGKSYWLDRPKFRCFRLKTPLPVLSTTYLTRLDSRAGCCAVFFCTTRILCRSLSMLACSSGLPILKPCSAANLTHRALYSALPLT